MDFFFALRVATALLRCEGRLSYRTLRRGLELDDETLGELKFELIEVRGLADDENGEVLVWRGEPSIAASTPPAPGSESQGTGLPEGSYARAPLAAPARPEAERRHLTVMFCDLVGSTALATRLDPEDLREIITAFQDRCRAAVERYEGFIARYMGDGLLVYFGYPRAHEDDAERAVRAGLEVVGSMAELSAKVGAAHEAVLAVRIGVATGPVVVGDLVGEGAAEEAAVVGETPNLAARLQGAAEPDQLVVSDATRRLVGERFELEDLGTQNLKGIETPQPIWRVVAARDGPGGAAQERRPSSGMLVGRQEEVGLLVRAWEGAREGRGHVVLVQGEGGIGKSRLVEALRERAGTDYTWIAIRASPFHVASALYPVIEHLHRVLVWLPGEDPTVRLDKLERAVRAYHGLPSEQSVPLFAHLMSLPLPDGRYPALGMSARQERDATLDALNEWLLEEAERRPLLMIWEDLHWADPTTVEMLGLLIEQVPTVQMLVVGTFRPDFQPPWDRRTHVTPITLSRLEPAEVEAIVHNITGGKTLPVEVLEHIIAKADGVPLYVEELTKAILLSPVLREGADRFELTGALSGMQVPETLQDSLMARLDRLPAVREIAQLGSVIGREFAYAVLRSLAPHQEAVLQDGLGELVAAELLYRRGRGERARYVFKHALIHDAAYASLLRRTRQEYHRQLATLLEERFPEVAAAHPELLARHHREAGAPRSALAYLERAGFAALDRSANVEAITHFRDALELLGELPESRERGERELAIQMALGPALASARGFADPGVDHAYARAWTLCHELGDEARQPLVLRGRQIFHLVSGRLEEAKAFAVQFVELAERLDDPGLIVGSCHALGQTQFFMGELAAARRTVERGVALFDPDRHRLLQWSGGQPGEQCYLYDAFVLWMLGYPDQARSRVEEANRMAEALPNPSNLINTLAFAATLGVLRRDLDEARTSAEAAIALCREHHNPSFLGHSTVLHGWASDVTSGDETAMNEISEGLAIYAATSARTWVSFFLGLKAEVCLRARRLDAGLDAVTEALRLTEAIGERCWEPELHRLHGELRAARAPEDAAADICYRRALDTARTRAARSWELRAAVGLGRRLAARGARAEARDLVEPIHNWFTEGHATPDFAEARALLDLVS